MRKLIIAALLLLALLLAPLALLRSETALIRVAHWAVDTFSDLRLELRAPVLRPFESIASAAEIHLYPKSGEGPPFVSILDFRGDIDLRDIFAADLSRSRLSAAAVILYVSDKDSTADPAPIEWIQYLTWLPANLDVARVHLVTASEETFIFPLAGLSGIRTPGGHFKASARAQYEGEPLDFDLALSAVRDEGNFTGLDMAGKFRAPDSGSEVSLEGELRGTRDDFHYDFRLVGNYKDVGEFMRGFRSYGTLRGGLQLQARMLGDTNGFELRDAQFLLNNLPDYGIEAAGSMTYDRAKGNSIRLVAAGELTSMEALVDWVEIDLAPLGRAQGSAVVTGTLDRPVIDRFLLHSDSDSGLSVNIAGRLEIEPENPSDNRIEVDVLGPQLAVLAPWTGALPYETGAFSASGLLTGTRGAIALPSLIVEMGAPGSINARVEGSAADVTGVDSAGLSAVRALDLKLKFAAPDSADLAGLLQQTLPGGFALDGDLQFKGDGDDLRPAGGAVRIVAEDMQALIRPTAGSIALDDSTPLSGLRADIAMTVSDTSALSRFTQMAVPALGSVDAQAELVQDDRAFSLADIQVNLLGENLDLRGRGKIDDLATLAGTRIDGNFDGLDPKKLLVSYLDELDYPDPMGELEGSFAIEHDAKNWNLVSFSLSSVEENGPLYIRSEGSVSGLNGPLLSDLDMRYRIRDPLLLEALTGLRMNPTEGELQLRSAKGKLDAENNVRIGETTLSAAVALQYREMAISDLAIEAYSPILHLGDLGLQARATGDTSYNPSQKLDEVEAGDRLEALLQKSPRFPTDIAIKIDGIIGEYTNIDSLDLHVTGLDNRYTLRRFTVGYDETLAELRGIIDLNARPPFVSVAGEALAIPLNTLGRDLGADTDIKGNVTVRGGLAAQGFSSDALLKDVDGSLAVALENAEIEGAAYDILATDLLAWIYSGAAREKSTHIDCTMGQFDLRDGVARSDSLYIETAKMVATGTAKIDMVKERLDVTITPRSKSRQLQVPSSIRLRGSFDNPQPTISPVAAAFDAYAEFLTLVPRMVGRLFGGQRKREKSKRPCLAVN